jgi:hypothetical protein
MHVNLNIDKITASPKLATLCSNNEQSFKPDQTAVDTVPYTTPEDPQSYSINDSSLVSSRGIYSFPQSLLYCFSETRAPTITQTNVIIIVTVLFLFWVCILCFAQLDFETLVVVSWAWIITPILFCQACYFIETTVVIYITILSYILLTAQLYSFLTFQQTQELNLFIDIYLLTQQTLLHGILRGGISFPVWSIVLTSGFVMCMRMLLHSDQDESFRVHLYCMHDTYIFTLVILSVLMYTRPALSVGKPKTDCKLP